jgi:hypothetical protein
MSIEDQRPLPRLPIGIQQAVVRLCILFNRMLKAYDCLSKIFQLVGQQLLHHSSCSIDLRIGLYLQPTLGRGLRPNASERTASTHWEGRETSTA